jgi:heme exporter protein B
MLLKEVHTLIKKELVLEWRQRYALNGMLLYVASTILICYISFSLKMNQLHPITWNALFWIIILFTAINAIAKSFMQERQGRYIYYYSIASPQGIILSKILYNTLLMLLLSITGFIFYSLVLGNPVQDQALFILNLVLGSLGFSVTLTMISGIASKAANNSTLMAILGFPVIVPILLMVIKISKNALDGLDRSISYNEILTLMAVNLLVGTVTFILFPYLWRS